MLVFHGRLRAGIVLWYHLNAAHAGGRRWLLQCGVLPEGAGAAPAMRGVRWNPCCSGFGRDPAYC